MSKHRIFHTHVNFLKRPLAKNRGHILMHVTAVESDALEVRHRWEISAPQVNGSTEYSDLLQIRKDRRPAEHNNAPLKVEMAEGQRS